MNVLYTFVGQCSFLSLSHGRTESFEREYFEPLRVPFCHLAIVYEREFVLRSTEILSSGF